MTKAEKIEEIRNCEDLSVETTYAAIEALRQEPCKDVKAVLDKIRAEIAELSHYYPMGHDYQIAITRCIEVIDKYKAKALSGAEMESEK